jgi:methionyl-tRNA formyltransferase
MNPWPLARTTLPGGRELLVIEARTVGEAPAGAAPGEVVEASERLVVATGAGALELVAVKRAGKQALPAADFLRGARLEPGARLGATAEGAER